VKALASKQTEGRKLSHIQICLKKNVMARSVRTGFEDVRLIHRALPEINLGEVNVTTEIFGHKLSVPLIIAAMTGGTAQAAKINSVLAEAAEQLGLGMGVGSQRAAIENSKLTYTFRIVREKAPNAFLIANIGCPQLTRGYGLKEAEAAVKMIKANALAIHMNPLQEAIQAEGETGYRGVLAKIGEICRSISVPVIAKETGAGVAAEDAKVLESVGVKGLDVGGAGGTSWAAVEYYRAMGARNSLHQRLGKTFWDWGIPTAVSLIEVKHSTRLTTIATGGIRTGVDVAKALALGADAVGLALPLLKPSIHGLKTLVTKLQFIIEELKTAMFLVGATEVRDLQKVPVVITGQSAEWLRARGFQLRNLEAGEYAE